LLFTYSCRPNKESKKKGKKMKQEGLIEPPGEPPWETLKKIAEALEENLLLKLYFCLDGAELKIQPPNFITSRTRQGENTIIIVAGIKKTRKDGQEVKDIKLRNEKGTIVGFRLRST